MSITADISVVLAWMFDEDQTPEALKVLRLVEREGLLVPPIWWYELENGILTGERRGRISKADSAAFLRLVRELPIRVDDSPRIKVSDAILAIGRQYELTAYDAAYVELAVREKSTLATFDTAMRRCAPKVGIKLLPK